MSLLEVTPQIGLLLETIPSKHTRKNYVNGIKKFELEPCFCTLLIFIIMGL